VWSEQQKLVASDGAAGDYFGYSVSVSGDTAVVGAYQDDTAGGADAGSAYVFRVPSADLSVTKTDGQTTAVPGQPVTYTIVVSNAGPYAAAGAMVADTVPAAIFGVSWSCVGSGGGTCTASGSGGIHDTVSLPAGASVTYTLSGTVSLSASGSLSNTATVAAPSGVTDPNLANNSATDTDTVAAVADLRVTKSDGQATAVPGEPVTYTIVVSNEGPSGATGATVMDTVPVAIVGGNWSCVGSGGGTCAASGSGNINDVVGVPRGATLTYTLSGTVSPAATGMLANTASVAAPPGTTDPNLANNSATDTDTLTPRTDLSVTKTDGQTTAVPGQPVTYTITVGNAGPSVVSGATISDSVPAVLLDVHWACSASPGSSCTAMGVGSINDTVSVLVGGTLVYTLTGPVDGGATGSLVNTASATPPAGVTDPNTTNNAATDTDTLERHTDLSVTKTDGQTEAVPGQPITYAIVVSNAGPSVATGATVDDTLPAVLMGAAWTCTASPGSSCGVAGAGSIHDTVSLLVGGTATYALTATVDGAATGMLVNTATVAVAAGTTDPDPANNSATDTDTLTPSADVSVTKADGQATAVPGQPVTYTIVVSNAGPSMAHGATVTDTLPAALTGATWTCTASSGSYCAPSGNGSINEIVHVWIGGTVTYLLMATIDAGATGSLSNTASAAVAEGTTDPNAANNTATDTDTLTPQADVAVTKTDGQTAAVPGQPITYAIVVSNVGPSVAAAATVSDALPAALTGASWTCTPSPGSSCSASGAGNINDSVNLLVSGTASYTVTATVNPSATGSLGNTASAAVAAGTTDPDPANNAATDTDTLTPEADLELVKSDAPDPVAPGGTLLYTIQLTNLGPSASSGMTLTDALPPEVSFVSSTPGPPTCTETGGTLTCSLPGLAPSASQSVTIQVGVDAGTSGAIGNTATVTGDETDPVSGNDSDTEPTTVEGNADLSVSKTDGQTTAVPGQAITYTIVATNLGPDPVSGATVADVLPASLTGASWTCVASPGSTCTASGSGNINDTVGMPVSGTATYTVTASIDPAATGTLDNTATVSVPVGFTDPDPSNDSAADTDTLTPEADLALLMSDAPDPVAPGGTLLYTIHLNNLGPSVSTGMTLTDTLPPEVSFVTATPGAPTCTETGGTLTCNLPGLAPGASQSVTILVTANIGTLGMINNTASVVGNETDPVSGNDSDSEPSTVGLYGESELVQGSALWADLASAGGAPDEDLFRIGQRPYSSYEVVVDGTSGDLGTGQGPALDRLASDGTLLQSAVAAGAGSSRSLRWENDSAAVVNDEYVRVRSAGCTTSCGPEDVYRIRSWDTTLLCPRFNNGATQVTVLVLQNTTETAIAGHARFWSNAGVLVGTQAFTMGPKAAFVVNTSTVPGVSGVGGTITLSHDGPYGTLVGKAVAVEPATGFTFDTALLPRVR
jgi:uncharacterized repeat protein (TIGR01451 family)